MERLQAMSIIQIHIQESVNAQDQEWKDIGCAVIYRHGLEPWSGTGNPFTHRTGAVISAVVPDGMTEENLATLTETLSRECSEKIRMAWRTQALRTLEGGSRPCNVRSRRRLLRHTRPWKVCSTWLPLGRQLPRSVIKWCGSRTSFRNFKHCSPCSISSCSSQAEPP